MAKKKKVDAQIDSSFQTIEGSLSRTEQFLEKYQKQLSIPAFVAVCIKRITAGSNEL